MVFKKLVLIGSPVLALSLLAAGPASAAELIVNGGFETTTNGGGQLGYNTNAAGWTTNGYNFLFPSGTADGPGVTGSEGNLQLWGPNNGSNNGLPASSPDGGNFVAADGGYKVDSIRQTVSGLTAGEQYVLGFWWAAGQQSGFHGATTEKWTVSLGSESYDTPTVSTPNHGFTPWAYQEFTFTANSGTEVLSFLAYGTPSGVPPFVLLDGVTMTSAVPEPATLSMLVLGLAGLGGAELRRRRKAHA